MKYSTGSYRIIFFCEFGSKLKIKQATGFTKARRKVNKYLTKNPNHSAVITHILWNSKNKNDKWEYASK